MEKRKALSKGRFVKGKVELSRLTPHSESASKLVKINLTEQVKKNATPTQCRISKSKNILNKRTSETPKPKIEDFEQKRKLVSNNQENLEAYYSSYIKALAQKLDKQKSQNQEIEEELKNMEQTFLLEETTLKQDLQTLLTENKKLKKDKLQQETDLMEENFQVRKDFEEFKLSIVSLVNEVTSALQSSNCKTLQNTVDDVVKTLSEFIKTEENLGVKVSLKGTASFSNVIQEIYSPRSSVSVNYKEAIVLHNYEASFDEELSLKVGDRVTVLKTEEEIWLGKIGDRIGKFPKHCVMLD